MIMLENTPVQLPAGIGPQFVESAVLNLVVQGKEAVAPSFLHLNKLALHQIAVVVQQLHIQHTADVRWLAGSRFLQIGREPDGVALKIAGIVHVNIDLLLRNGLAKSVKAFYQRSESLRVGMLLFLLMRTAVAADTKGSCFLLLCSFHNIVFSPKCRVVACVLNSI